MSGLAHDEPARARAFGVESIKLLTSDGIALDGDLYEPERHPGRPAVLLVHGIRWNYRSGPSRWMAPWEVTPGCQRTSLHWMVF